MEETMDSAVKVISKWQSYDTASEYCPNTSLFDHHSRDEVLEFMRAAKELQASLQYFNSQNNTTSSSSSSSKKTATAQNHLRLAMKRLGREFFCLLKSNRDHVPPRPRLTRSDSLSSTACSSTDTNNEDNNNSINNNNDNNTNLNTNDGTVYTSDSYDDDNNINSSSMDDLKMIADCMIAAGYTKKCIKIYKITRKSFVDQAILKLGAKRMKKSKVQKMDWAAIDKKLNKWLSAVSVSVHQIFMSEKILCDHLFSSSYNIPPIKDTCFAEVCRDAAMIIFRIPGKIAKHSKKSPDKLFRYLDLYEALSDVSQDVDLIFSSDLTSAIRSQAKSSKSRITEAVRLTLTEFEATVQKDTSKTLVPGGGVHSLTKYVMSYFSNLVVYTSALDKTLADCPLSLQTPLPESYFESETTSSPVALRCAWLALVLLCKLDAKSEHYKDVSLSYLFLVNNLQYVVSKVTNSRLRTVLGDKWVAKHTAKVLQYAANYERMGWGRVMGTLPDDLTVELPIDKTRDCFRRFNAEFEAEYRKEVDWVVLDAKLRDDMKASVTRKVVRRYRGMYDKYKDVLAKNRERGVIESVVKFTPSDLENYLSDLLDGPEPDDVVPGPEEELPTPGPEPAGMQRRRRRLLNLVRHHQ